MRLHRGFARTRKRARYRWIRDYQYTAAPGNPFNVDMLADYKTLAGISINLPEFTIWRIHLRISIIIAVSAALTAEDGVGISCFVDDPNQVQLNQVTNENNQQYLIQDFAPATQAWMNGNFTVSAAASYPVFRDFDVKAHRRLRSTHDSLILQVQGIGNASITNICYQMAVLTREGR